MIFGKHINRYYLRYAPLLLIGLFALAAVDYLQLVIPELYRMVINGMNQGYVTVDGVEHVFDMAFLLDRICMPMVAVVVSIVFCRFLWRVTIFGAAIRVETNLRDKMFDHARHLSREYYQVNKVGNLMSLFTNDLQAHQPLLPALRPAFAHWPVCTGGGGLFAAGDSGAVPDGHQRHEPGVCDGGRGGTRL